MISKPHARTPDYSSLRFVTNDSRNEEFCTRAVAHAQAGGGLRVLDIGCGEGGLLCDLARALGPGEYVGVDISADNISAAKGRPPLPGRKLQWIRGDYLKQELAPFDLLVSVSTLQLIPAADDVLFAKIAQDMRPGARLMISIPHDCIYNRLLNAARGLLRMTRCWALERLFLALARALHGRKHDEAFLMDRLPYLFVTLKRFYGASLEATAERHGLRQLRREYLPHDSIAQHKHSFIVLEKTP